MFPHSWETILQQSGRWFPIRDPLLLIPAVCRALCSTCSPEIPLLLNNSAPLDTHGRDLAPFSGDFASRVAGSGDAALSLRDGLATADRGGRNAAFPSARESCRPHLNGPQQGSFSKAVALQTWSPAATGFRQQCGASQSFTTAWGRWGDPTPQQLPMAAGAGLVDHPWFPLFCDCSRLCQRPA